MKYLLFLLFLPAVLACIVPQDGMKVDKSAEFCSDVFYLDKGIVVSGNDLNVNCNGAVLKSWSGGRGISIENSVNVTVSDCRVVNYNLGFIVVNSSKVFLNDNHLVKNRVGARFVNVTDSTTFNHDVSLVAPFEVIDSSNNVFSLTNKVVDGKFCSFNFCNARRNAVFTFAAPEATENQMVSWLFGRVGKSAARLKTLLLEGLV